MRIREDTAARNWDTPEQEVDMNSGQTVVGCN